MITRKHHQKHIVNVGKNTLASVLDAILESDCPTRKSIAGKTGYSEVTVGKVMQAIYLLSLASKETRKPSDNGRVCAHLAYSDNVRLLVLDISTRRFTMTLISSGLSCDFHYVYTYSDSLRYEENLMIFLSNGAQRLTELNLDYSASLLISDNIDGVQRISHTSQIMPPPACNLSLIREKISSVLGSAPDLTVSPDEAIKQYLLLKHGKDSAYILTGQTLSAYYLSKAGELIVCKPWDVIVDGVTLKEYLCLSGDISVIFSSAARLINILDCTFSPKNIILQSDNLALGREFANETKDFLDSLYRADRDICILDSAYLAQVTGGALCLRKWMFKELIVSFEDSKM